MLAWIIFQHFVEGRICEWPIWYSRDFFKPYDKDSDCFLLFIYSERDRKINQRRNCWAKKTRTGRFEKCSIYPYWEKERKRQTMLRRDNLSRGCGWMLRSGCSLIVSPNKGSHAKGLGFWVTLLGAGETFRMWGHWGVPWGPEIIPAGPLKLL